MKYWIEYTDGTRKIFEAEDDKAAHHYFMMEGDHAYDWGRADKAYFKKCLEGPKTWGDIFHTPKCLEDLKGIDLPPLRHSTNAKYELDTDDDDNI